MKKYLLSALVLLASPYVLAQAGICDLCDSGAKTFANEQDIKNVIDKAMTCDDAYAAEARSFYEAEFPQSQKRKKEKIAGHTLMGTVDELKTLKRMLGKKPPSTWKAAAESCPTVLCALGKLMDSDESAQRVLAFAKKTGYTISVDQDSNPKGVEYIWPKEEIRTLDRAFRRLPSQYYRLSSLDIITRTPKGYRDVENDSVAAWARPGYKSFYGNLDGVINVLDGSILSHDTRFRYMSLIHELAHHVDYSAEGKTKKLISDSKEFRNLSGWTTSKKTKKENGETIVEETHSHNKDHQFVRDYAASAPAEDFAEAFGYYVMMPEILKKTDLAKYNYIKNKFFNGVEYNQMTDSIKSKKDSEVFKDCLAKISTIKPTTYGARITTVENKKIDYWPGIFQNRRSLDFEPLNCLPTPQISVSGLEYCDMGDDKSLLLSAYEPVLNSISEIVGKMVKGKELAPMRAACWQKKDFTASCLLEDVKMPMVSEDEAKLLRPDLAKKFAEFSAFNVDESFADLQNNFPVAVVAANCLDSAIDKISTSNGSPIVKMKGQDSGNWYRYKNNQMTCDRDILVNVVGSDYKFDDPQVLATNLMESVKIKELQGKVVSSLVSIAPSCKKLMRYNRNCMVEKLTQRLESENPGITVPAPVIQSLVNKFN